MTVSLVGAKVRGTGFPTAYAVAGLTPTNIPTTAASTFGVALLSGAPTGTFSVGESLSFSGGGTADLAQDLSGASTRRLILNNLSGTISGTITGGTSGATASVSAFEGMEEYSFQRNASRPNRSARFMGSVYVLCYATVFKLDETNGRWVEAYRHRTPNGDRGASQKSGLHIVTAGGKTCLAFLYGTGFNYTPTYRIKFDGTTWSEASVIENQIGFAARSLVWNNAIYVWGFVEGYLHMAWDAATDGCALVPTDIVPTYYPGVDLCVYRNRLLAIAFYDNNLDRPYILEYSGGAWTLNTQLDTQNGSGGSYVDSGWCLFVGPDSNLYAIYHKNQSGTGWRCAKLTPSGSTFTQTLVDTVIPSALRWPSGPSTGGFWTCYVDCETGSDTSNDAAPDVYLFYAAAYTTGTTRSVMQFVDDSTTMTIFDTGTPVDTSLPHDRLGGGTRSFLSGVLGCEITAITPVSGGERWTVKIESPASGAVSNVKFRALFRPATSSSNSGVPRKWGYLSNPSAGSLSVGNREVTGLTSGTSFQVTWLAVSQDAQTNFSRQLRMPLVYT